MALKATIFKIDLSITDLDRHYYADHALTVARHPSESDRRMMLRILAFAFSADEQLSFTKGLSEVDDPDLWQKNYANEIELWIELGQPSEQRIKKGCNAAKHMLVYSYATNAFDMWYKKDENALNLRKNLTIATVDEKVGDRLANLVTRQMAIQCTIQDGQAWFYLKGEKGEETIEVSLTRVKVPA